MCGASTPSERGRSSPIALLSVTLALAGVVDVVRAERLPAEVEELRAHVRKLERELERTVDARDRAIDDLEAERDAAKRALDRVLEQSVTREAALAAAARREATLQRTVDAAVAERERLLEEIVAQAESRTRERISEGLERATLVDRLRTVELDRDEAVRLGDEARRMTGALADEAETLRARILELEHQLVRATSNEAPAGRQDVAALESELAAARARSHLLGEELRGARRELRALRTAREGLEKALTEARERRSTFALAPREGEGTAPAEGSAEELQRQLSLERERRATLESELVRLSVSSDVADRYREAWDALQNARAEILLLRERLDEERSARGELQDLLERAQRVAESQGVSEDTPLERLIEVAETHGHNTERLEKDLRDANDRITRLRGLLETVEAPDGTGSALASLEEENERLRESLTSAEQRVGKLSGQAALARRLAEIVYARSP